VSTKDVDWTNPELFGTNYPENALLLVYASRKATNVPVCLSLPIALRVLWHEFQRPSNHQDTNFAGNSDGTRVIMLGCYGGESSARDGSRFPCDIMVGEDTAADPNTWVWLVSFKYATPYGVPSLYTANRRPAGMAAMIQGARIYTTDGSVPTPYPTGLAVNTTVIGINI
jgi:hypothetical protein